MMKSLPVLLMTSLPLQAQAQQTQLTLNCQIESAYDVRAKRADASSGSFSAIVRMSSKDDIAKIEATTDGCFDYEGSFDELQVSGECNRTVETTQFHAFMRIDRITGKFEHIFYFGDVGPAAKNVENAVEYSGHCNTG